MKPFSELVESIPPSGIRRFFDLVMSSEGVISLGVGEPDFMTPWAIRHEAIQSIVNGETAYTSNRGLLECRTAIERYMHDRFELMYRAEDEILVTSGVSQGLDIVLRALLNPGDEVVVPQPCFVCYLPLVTLAGGVPVSLDTTTTGFIPDPAALRAQITDKTKAILLCTPSNPTGRLIPREVLAEIATIAKEADCWILSDEIYAELLYQEEFVSMGHFPDVRDRVAIFNGFSKSFSMTGWRLGFICAPEPVISRALKIHQYGQMCANTTAQIAACRGLYECLADIDTMRDSYRERRNLLVNSFNDIGLETIMPEGAFYCFPDIRSTGLGSEEFAIQLLQQQNVAVVPGTAFGSQCEGFVRCCYATAMTDLEEAVRRIRLFVDGVKEGALS